MNALVLIWFYIDFSVGAVERRLRKYRDGCNRILLSWERDIKENTACQLKLPGIRKLHIFKWLLPFCKNWKDFMADYTFDLYVARNLSTRSGGVSGGSDVNFFKS